MTNTDICLYIYVCVYIFICVCKYAIIVSDKSLGCVQYRCIIWPNPALLLTGPLRTNFREFLIKAHTFSFKKRQLKRSSVKFWLRFLWRNMMIGIIHETMVVQMIWVWTFFNNYIYRHTYIGIYLCLSFELDELMTWKIMLYICHVNVIYTHFCIMLTTRTKRVFKFNTYIQDIQNIQAYIQHSWCKIWMKCKIYMINMFGIYVSLNS